MSNKIIFLACTDKLENLEQSESDGDEEFGVCSDHNHSGSDSENQKLLPLSPLANKSSLCSSSALSSQSTPIHQSPPPLSKQQQIVQTLSKISPEDLVSEFSSMMDSDGSQVYTRTYESLGSKLFFIIYRMKQSI